jgi:predicted RND superfamily exporter protein
LRRSFALKASAGAGGWTLPLQGELSELVQGSVLRGLGGLLGLFFVIVLIVSRSLPTALVMVLCLALTPLTLFGLVGLFRMPVDIISAPAANVALPLGIDDDSSRLYSPAVALAC